MAQKFQRFWNKMTQRERNQWLVETAGEVAIFSIPNTKTALKKVSLLSATELPKSLRDELADLYGSM